MPTSHTAIHHGVSWGKVRRADAAVDAVCTDMHRPYVNAVTQQLPKAASCSISFMCCNTLPAALDDVRQEFFRAGL